jgi:hypothetical protein
MVEYSAIVAVDMEGKTWRTVCKPVVLKYPSIKLRVTCVCDVLIFAIGLGF